MDIECYQLWRNDQYDILFEELKERYESLAMEIPKKDLRKLPPEWITGKITFDPAYAWSFYTYIDNPNWTCACLLDEWFILDITYDKFKELRDKSIQEENDSNSSNEQETEQTITINQSAEAKNL